MRVLLLAVATIPVVLGGCGLALDDQGRLERARAALAADDPAAAAIDTKSVLQREPNWVEARLLLAEALLKTGDVVGAEKEYGKAAELLIGSVGVDSSAKEQFVDALLKRAALQLGLGKPAESLAGASRALELVPDSTSAYAIAAQAAYASGQPLEARRYAQSLLDLEPRSATANGVLGFVAAREGDHAGAEERFLASLEQQPNQPPVRAALTQLQMVLGKPAEAVITIVPLLRLTPLDPRVLALFDSIDLTVPGVAERVAEIATVIEAEDPRSPIPALLLGRSAMLGRDFASAAPLFAKSASLGGGSYAAINRFLALRAAGQRAESEGALQEWVDANPDDQAARFALASAWLDSGDEQRARAEFEQLLAGDVNSPVVLNNLAWLYGEIGDPRAVTLARQAHRLAPNNAFIADTLGWVLYQTGVIDEAVEVLTLAARQAPEIAEIRYHLSVALARQGELEAASRAVAEPSPPDGSARE